MASKNLNNAEFIQKKFFHFQIMEKKKLKYYCEKCDFSCNQKCDWERHIARPKHLNVNNFKLECFCGKTYSTHSGLWKHRKIHEAEKEKDKQIIDILLSIIQTNATANANANMNINVNSNNKTFNLHFYLNETCKNAMNIDDFVSSVKVSLEDLENTGRHGYVEGITHIVCKHLNDVEQSMRPIHCSDSKREVFYIRTNDEWQKENATKPILTKAIHSIAHENIKQIQHWRNKYPDCTQSNSLKNDLYLKIVSNSMNGITQEESIHNVNKIISNIAKHVSIPKGRLFH
jgi:hypothetical protein